MNAVLQPALIIPLATQHQWPVFWENIQTALRASKYRIGTRRTYRSVIRRFCRFTRKPPSEVNRRDIDDYLYTLALSNCSAQWLAMNISILRAVFDKCCDQTLLNHRRCPRRPWTLPGILNQQETHDLLAAARCPRDALLLSLLYGCGLRPGEALRLQWGDLDSNTRLVTVQGREIRLPSAVMDIVKAGTTRCAPTNWVFPGATPERHLTPRSLTRIIRSAAQDAGLVRPVTAMTLRHSYAVHQLQVGVSIRELQDLLGHTSVVTTMRYLHLLPAVISSPADQIILDLPTIHTEGADLPFAADQSSVGFTTWLKNRWLLVFNRFRASG